MKVLAFDTATEATAVALALSGSDTRELRDDPPAGARPGHVGRLLPMVAQLLDGAGLQFSQLDRLAVGTGPGTFTGLRIGIATARSLAIASRVPLVGVSTLLSLARGAQEDAGFPGAQHVVAVLDARRGEAFAAAYGASGEPAAVLRPGAYGPERLAAAVRTLATAPLAIGGGAVKFRAILERAGAVVPVDDSRLHRVSAAVHAQIAREGAAPPSSDEVRPDYIRPPDADISGAGRGR